MNYLILIFLFIASIFSYGQTTEIRTTSKTNKESKSLHISSEDNSYSLSAKYSKGYDNEVKKIATQYFGNPSKSSTSEFEWNNNGLEVTVKKGKLNIEADYAQNQSLKQFENDFKAILGMEAPPTPPVPPAPPAPPRP